MSSKGTLSQHFLTNSLEQQPLKNSKPVQSQQGSSAKNPSYKPTQHAVMRRYMKTLSKPIFIIPINIILLCINSVLTYFTLNYNFLSDSKNVILGICLGIFLIVSAIFSFIVFDMKNKIRSIFRDALTISNIIYPIFIMVAHVIFVFVAMSSNSNTNN